MRSCFRERADGDNGIFTYYRGTPIPQSYTHYLPAVKPSASRGGGGEETRLRVAWISNLIARRRETARGTMSKFANGLTNDPRKIARVLRISAAYRAESRDREYQTRPGKKTLRYYTAVCSGFRQLMEGKGHIQCPSGNNNRKNKGCLLFLAD